MAESSAGIACMFIRGIHGGAPGVLERGLFLRLYGRLEDNGLWVFTGHGK